MIGKRLQQLRLKAGYKNKTQFVKIFNEKMGQNLSRGALIHYEENTRTRLDPKLIIDFADFFNCSIDYLFGRKNELTNWEHEGVELSPSEQEEVLKFLQFLRMKNSDK